MIYWYCNEQFCVVQWGSTLSKLLSVSNGVSKRGIMSPVLINIYMDDLSSALNDSMIGCSFMWMTSSRGHY